MAFKWKNSVNNIGDNKEQYKAPKIKTEECSAYNAAFSPTCTNRGKYKKEIILCWDTIKNLRYENNKFVIGKIFYKLLQCIICEDYYIEEEGNEFKHLEQTFKCCECAKKEKL